MYIHFNNGRKQNALKTFHAFLLSEKISHNLQRIDALIHVEAERIVQM